MMKYTRNVTCYDQSASLMRNVKREKSSVVTHSATVTLFDSQRGTDNNMQALQTLADSCNNSKDSLEQNSNSIASNMSSDSEEADELQKEFDELMDENRRLKDSQVKKDVLKRKISLIRKENENLKTNLEQQLREIPKPDSNTSEPSSNFGSPTTAADKIGGTFSKSFLLTSTVGGIHIEPIESNGVSQKVSLNGLLSAHNSSTSPGNYFDHTEQLKKPCTKTAETQTSMYNTTSHKSSMYHYSPRIKVATTEEDEEAHRFVQEFKARRIALKLTQSDIGEELNQRAGARYGQSYISRMESIQLSTAIVLRMKPLLLKLLEEKEVERRFMKSNSDLDEDEYQMDRKRKKRTNFSPEQSILLTKYFAEQPRPSPTEIDDISNKIGVDRNSVKMWFNNKRQSEKFRLQPLPTIGSISSVSSINPYAIPFSTHMPPSFIMSGLMSNMQNSLNNMTPSVTTASLNSLKFDYNTINQKLPNNLDTASLVSQPPFLFNKDLSQFYQNSVEEAQNRQRDNDVKPKINTKDLSQLYQSRVEEAQNRLLDESSHMKLNKDLSQLYQNTVASTMNNLCKEKLDSLVSSQAPTNKIMENVPLSLASQTPFMFSKDLSQLYQSRSEESQSPNNNINELYKRGLEDNRNKFSGVPSMSPNGGLHLSSVKSLSPPSTLSPAFSLSQTISRNLSQSVMNQEPSTTSPSYSDTP